MRIATISILAFALLSVSCSSSAPPPPPAQAAQKAPPEKQKTVIDEQLKAIDKAKAVQDVMDQRTKTLDGQMESSDKPPEKKDASQ